MQALANFLELLDTAPGVEFYTDSMTVTLTLDIFRALQDGDTEGRSAGLTFLADYSANLPSELEELRLAYQDSIAVFTPREETRAQLGEGFQYWSEANFVQLIGFFEKALELGGLTPEQETIARGLLAGAYQSAGRSEEAESTYRGILDIDPFLRHRRHGSTGGRIVRRHRLRPTGHRGIQERPEGFGRIIDVRQGLPRRLRTTHVCGGVL